MKNNVSSMSVYAPTYPDEVFDSIGQQIQQHAHERGDHPALITDQTIISWRTLLTQVNQIANRLRAEGLQTGDSVAALSENSANYVALYLGTLVAGGCMVPLSGMASPEALALMLADCEARFLFVSSKTGTCCRSSGLSWRTCPITRSWLSMRNRQALASI